MPVGSKLLEKKWRNKIDHLENDRLKKVEGVMVIEPPIKPHFLQFNRKRDDLLWCKKVY